MCKIKCVYVEKNKEVEIRGVEVVKRYKEVLVVF